MCTSVECNVVFQVLNEKYYYSKYFEIQRNKIEIYETL